LTVKGPGGAATNHLTVTVDTRTLHEPAANSKPKYLSAAPNDVEAIREAVQKFVRAFNFADIEGIKKIWPTIPNAVKVNYERSYFAENVRSSMELSCEGEPKLTAEDSAEWSCTEVKSVRSVNGIETQRPLPLVVRLRFKKLRDGNWVIDSRQNR
jgi:hypothetical protein